MRHSFYAAAAAMLLWSSCAAWAQQVTGTYFFPDKPFPQYMQLWQEGWSFKDASGKKLIYAKPDMPLGGYAFIYFRNDGAEPLSVSDITIGGIKMSDAIAPEEEVPSPDVKYRSSILISKLPKAQIEKLKELGWPAWWKPEPAIVEPGGCGSVIIRMRRPTKAQDLDVALLTERAQTAAPVPLKKAQPQFGTIGFSEDMKTVYLYPRLPKARLSVTKVLMDGADVTAACTISSDPTTPLSSIVLKLAEPLKSITYHDFVAQYSDGSAAHAGIRAWGQDMIYGVWSSPAQISDPEQALKSFIDDYAQHNVNCVMPYVVGQERSYFDSDAGWQYCESKGVGRMIHWPEGKHDATILFAMDEPDANDANFPAVPQEERLGGMGQWLTSWTRILHKSGPNSPILLNVDNTYKPENWYMYHQMADIPAIDPYYTGQQDFQDFGDPYYYQAHTRPTYVQAVATISQSSCQPKPLHVILLSCRYQNTKNYKGRFATPEEKRMEVYYSIGSGAKGISYWMFASGGDCNCLSDGTEGAAQLWKEIGLLGAEVRTAAPVITSSCPADLPTKASDFLWVRTLVSGSDTLAVVTVNDNVAGDRLGTVVKPAENAKVRVRLPAWINPKDAFQVTSEGIKDIAWKRSGDSVDLELGTFRISSFVIITGDAALRTQLQDRYQKMFAANVAKLNATSGN